MLLEVPLLRQKHHSRDARHKKAGVAYERRQDVNRQAEIGSTRRRRGDFGRSEQAPDREERDHRQGKSPQTLHAADPPGDQVQDDQRPGGQHQNLVDAGEMMIGDGATVNTDLDRLRDQAGQRDQRRGEPRHFIGRKNPRQGAGRAGDVQESSQV